MRKLILFLLFGPIFLLAGCITRPVVSNPCILPEDLQKEEAVEDVAETQTPLVPALELWIKERAEARKIAARSNDKTKFVRENCQ